MTGARIAIEAHAKINLVLDLLGPRDDGYTEIATIFQTVELADRVTIEVEPGAPCVTLIMREPRPCADEENLAVRAARAWLDATNAARAITIRLEKEIPAGAGLGGGSSDAAAVLRGLFQLTGAPSETDLLAGLAAQLGSDVPYFLVGGLALGTGRGERIEPLADFPPTDVVLARASPPLSTALVYREARKALTPRVDAPNISRFLRHLREQNEALPPVSNELFPAAARLDPGIADMVGRLAALGGRAAMTGSGSAVFGLFDDRTSARHAADAIARAVPEAWVRVTRTNPRYGLRTRGRDPAAEH
ncbi:MAG: 4-(cytidine 5'-diphospho)-2-C-methyl-D-erythritol kinase [Acidobacteria bacterium]|nr:4-(cytidine 5'-diphospho)-2-C-methyl-D-erythritol kinase [Acidobacteriota bacterium]